MNSIIILALLAGIPLLLALIMRVSAVYFFVSVAGGVLLSQFLAEDTNLAVNTFISHSHYESYIVLGLLILPVILTIIFMRKTLSGKKFVFHLIPLVVTSAMFSTFIMVSLPGGVRHQLITNPIGRTANSAQNVLIVASVILTLLLTWFTKRHVSHGKKH